MSAVLSGPRRSIRSRAALLTAAVCVALTASAVPDAEATSRPSVALKVSTESDRSPSRSLHRSTVHDDVYVFASPSVKVRRVSFWLNASTSTNPYRTETGRPYDLAGTASNGRAYALDTDRLREGWHTVIAKVWTSTGATASTTATFLVDRPAAQVAPAPAPEPAPTPPAPAAPVSGECDSTSLPGPLPTYPDASTTGVPDGTALTKVAGDYRTKADGEVIRRMDIAGQLIVEHDDVKVVCSRVRGATTNKGLNLQMWLTTLGTTTGTTDGSALKWSNYTLRRVDIMGTTDGLKAQGNVDVQDSYIHDLFRTTDASQSSGWTHNDGVQIDKGANIRIKHNTFAMWSFGPGEQAGAHLGKSPYGDGKGYTTSAIMIASWNGTLASNVVIEDNLIRGRTSKYIHIPGTVPVKGVVIRDNAFGRENRDFPRLLSIKSGLDVTVTGNTYFDTGEPISG